MEMFSLTIVVFPFCSGMHNFAVNTMVKTPARVDRWPLKRLVTWYCKWDNVIATMPWSAIMIWYLLSKTTFLSDLNEYLMFFLSYLQLFIAISKLVGLELCLRFMLYSDSVSVGCM
jgi:hypothetical protein